jgi:hypothetical protein
LVDRDMANLKLQELAKAKAKVAKLEQALASEREGKLRNLHTDVGFESREELIAALRGLGGARAGGAKRGRKPGRPPGRTKSGRKKRAKITPELRDQIIAAVKGGATGQAVADKYGVSLPTVQNIKNAAGLTKKRKGR